MYQILRHTISALYAYIAFIDHMFHSSIADLSHRNGNSQHLSRNLILKISQSMKDINSARADRRAMKLT